jgi:hypothetical protein
MSCSGSRDHAPCSPARPTSCRSQERSPSPPTVATWRGTTCSDEPAPAGPLSAVERFRRHQRPGPAPHRRPCLHGRAGDRLPGRRRRAAPDRPEPGRDDLRARVVLEGATTADRRRHAVPRGHGLHGDHRPRHAAPCSRVLRARSSRLRRGVPRRPSQSTGIGAIASFDKSIDGVTPVTRIEPLAVHESRDPAGA